MGLWKQLVGCLRLLRQPGSLLMSSYWLWAIEFRTLEVAQWKKPSVGPWQLCHCEVTERAVQSPNPIRAWFGTSSITVENPTEQGGSWANLSHLASPVRRLTNVSIFVTWPIRNTLCCHEMAKQLVRKGKEPGKRIMSPPQLNSDQWPVHVRLRPSSYSYLELSNTSDQIIWLLWAAVTFKLNKVQLLKH